ncbi:MAG: NAD(P)-binding domain-containing protein [Roseiflexaceae bacterium]|nr:NAD(P)-binding domain-containing protein [Roseiflexaceae bacterium]
MLRSPVVLPTAIIGAGPVGLAAAAHLHERGLPFVMLESGSTVGHSVRHWGHVQLFSPWQYCIDHAARRLLEPTGWQQPDPEGYPTGHALVERYLAPLAAHPAIAPALRLNSQVTAITRAGMDKLKHAGRADAPFALSVRSPAGDEAIVYAGAVIDASGTYDTPSPLGANGVPARGERAHQAQIVYGIPDVLGTARTRYAGKRVLVAGSGHSAFNAVLDLAALAAQEDGTAITWVVRRGELGTAYGGGAADGLAARGALGQRMRALVERGTIRLVTGWQTDRVAGTADGLVIFAGAQALEPVDEIIVATGMRPNLSMLGELRLGLDAAIEAPTALAPLIDPNLHSCGTVRPHGADELAHPEPNFYMIGMKSYGRAPTFLLLTGYEQARSVVAALAGDWEAARRVELELPETGVCSGPIAAGGAALDAASCCGTPAPTLARTAPLLISLTPARPAANGACCTPAAQANCCAPAEKNDCCGTTELLTSASCGCEA